MRRRPSRSMLVIDWNAELKKVGPGPRECQDSRYGVKNGFLKGALRIANTPEFKSRKATYYHPNQFAPRLGLAFQITPKTVMRSSFALTVYP